MVSVGVGPAKATVWKGFHAVLFFECTDSATWIFVKQERIMLENVTIRNPKFADEFDTLMRNQTPKKKFHFICAIWMRRLRN